MYQSIIVKAMFLLQASAEFTDHPNGKSVELLGFCKKNEANGYRNVSLL